MRLGLPSTLIRWVFSLKTHQFEKRSWRWIKTKTQTYLISLDIVIKLEWLENGSVDANRSDPCVFDNSESAYFCFSALFRPFRLVEFMGNIPYLLEKMPECMTSVTEGVWDSLRCSVCKTCTMESRNFWRLKKKHWPPKLKWWWSWSLWTSEIRPYGHETSCISERVISLLIFIIKARCALKCKF